MNNIYNISILDSLVVNDFVASVITHSTIDLIWSSPTAVLPIRYDINRRCRILCDSLGPSVIDVSVSSPHNLTGIPPYSQCSLTLIGIYGNEMTNLATHEVITNITGMIT